ncbi:TPA: hypothetical protein DIC20_02640 [Candidatus Dependentiae bacterium]|nr:hypothetical protein [Candidatus Dependentiae bacterium]HCU00577.1 hypothetical protein [Candidatus Dependentiae bacterium]
MQRERTLSKQSFPYENTTSTQRWKTRCDYATLTLTQQDHLQASLELCAKISAEIVASMNTR